MTETPAPASGIFETDQVTVSRKMLWVVRLCLIAALGVSGYLLQHTLTGSGSLAGCAADSAFDCESVLNSHWSKVGPLPSSVLAIATYIMMLGALNLVHRPKPQTAWLIAGLLSVSVLGAAIWFSVLQFVHLQTICVWCMSAHVLGGIGALMVMIMMPKSKRMLAMVGVMPVLAMISLQVGQKDISHTVEQIVPTQGTIQIGAKQVLLMGNRVAIDPSKHPLMGSIDAKEFLMYLFDYTCPHCRLLHTNLQQAITRYGDQLGIIALPMPLHGDCNPLVQKNEDRHTDACSLAMFSLAVFKNHPQRYAEFDHWLVKQTPDEAQARVKAIEIFGTDEALKKALVDPWIAKEIKADIDLYQLAGGGVIPKLIGKNTLIAGRPGDIHDLYDLLEEELGLVPVTKK